METKTEITAPERALLELLIGCPNGATTYNLVENFDVDLHTIASLVDAGLVTLRQDQIARYRPNVYMVWVLITEAGAALIADGVPMAPMR